MSSGLLYNFFNQELTTQITDALKTPRKCGDLYDARDALKCQLMSCSREAFEWIFLFMLMSLATTLILAYLLYIKMRPALETGQLITKQHDPECCRPGVGFVGASTGCKQELSKIIQIANTIKLLAHVTDTFMSASSGQ